MNLAERIKHGWEVSAEGYSAIVQDDFSEASERAWASAILGERPREGRLRILDFGCGPGYFAIIMARRGHDALGADLSPAMIEQARKNACSQNVHARFEVIDDTFEPQAGSFDMIVSRNVVWSLADPETVFATWLRLLAPGGKALVFDGDYLRDLRRAQKDGPSYAEGYRKRYLELYGSEPKLSYSNYEEARGWRTELPLAGEARPSWDKAALSRAGFSSVRIEENVNDRVFADARQRALCAELPMFLVTATR